MTLRHSRVELYPAGGNGAAVKTQQLYLNGHGKVVAIKVDYVNQPAGVDLVIKADNSTGPTLFTATSTNTDVPLTPVGMPGIDETGAAVAATDSSSGGWPFLKGLYFDVAQGDAGATKHIDIDVLWER